MLSITTSRPSGKWTKTSGINRPSSELKLFGIEPIFFDKKSILGHEIEYNNIKSFLCSNTENQVVDWECYGNDVRQEDNHLDKTGDERHHGKADEPLVEPEP